jgi:hypothetical protein
MHPNNKFMVRLLSGLTPELLFILGWGSIAMLFLVVVAMHQRKVTRRNFRASNDDRKSPPRVDTRSLSAGKPGLPKKLVP